MSLTGQRTPELLSVTATNVAASIFSLIQTLRPNTSKRACFLQVQFDIAGTGNLYIGNSDVTSTNCGANLVASQANQQFASDSNLILLDEIYLLTSAASGQVNLVILCR